jgi:hypothetical protein
MYLLSSSGIDLWDNGVSAVKRIISLAAIEVFVWLILLAITFVISKGAFAISFGTATLIDRIATQVARVSVSAALVLLWLLMWKKVADNYLSKMLSRKEANA